MVDYLRRQCCHTGNYWSTVTSFYLYLEQTHFPGQQNENFLLKLVPVGCFQYSFCYSLINEWVKPFKRTVNKQVRTCRSSGVAIANNVVVLRRLFSKLIKIHLFLFLDSYWPFILVPIV